MAENKFYRCSYANCNALQSINMLEEADGTPATEKSQGLLFCKTLIPGTCTEAYMEEARKKPEPEPEPKNTWKTTWNKPI